MSLIYWHAFPIGKKRDGYYHRKVWKLFGKNGIPIWWWDSWSSPLERR